MKTLHVLSLLLLFGCQASKVSNQTVQSFCDTVIDSSLQPTCTPDMMCTSDYRTVVIQVEDNSGNPVELERYSISNLTLGKTIEIESPISETGYTIAEDLMMFEIDQTGHCIELSGWLDGKLVLQYGFLVGHDCCHVKLLAGPENITI